MLKLKEQVTTIASVNMRTERHGEDPVPACDIGIHFESGSKILDSFEKGLSEAMYSAANDEPSTQRRIPGAEDPSAPEGPRFRFNGVISTFKIKKEWPGYKAVITWGDLASSVGVNLEDVKVTKISAEPKDGGTCGVSLQLQCHPEKEQYGDLAMINGREIRLTLIPPSASELKKLEKEAAKKKDGETDPD